MADTISRFSRLREIPPAVWALGFVSLLMDVSSEIIHALLPVYLVTVLGASMLTVGFIEGIAEATASITKVFSGALSDWLGKRIKRHSLHRPLIRRISLSEDHTIRIANTNPVLTRFTR